MKTTLELAAPLFEEAKRVAAAEGTTLRALIEAGLRSELNRRRSGDAFRLGDASFGGRGLSAGFADAGWERIRDAAYETSGT